MIFAGCGKVKISTNTSKIASIYNFKFQYLYFLEVSIARFTNLEVNKNFNLHRIRNKNFMKSRMEETNHVDDENQVMDESDEDVSGEGESNSDEEIAPADQEVQVDFEGRNPIDSDVDGIKQLLHQLFLKAHINTTELSNILIGQNYIGSVLKQCWDEEMSEDEDDDENVVFGITSAINLTSRKDAECVKQLKSMILERAEKDSTDATLKLLRDIFSCNDRATGFLINERFINIPTQICVPLLENLVKEIKRAAEKKMPYNFDYLVMIVKIQRLEGKNGKPNEDFYSNPEEEYFVQESLASYEYCVKSESDSGLSGKWRENDPETTPFRKVIILDGKKLPNIVNGVTAFIHGS